MNFNQLIKAKNGYCLFNKNDQYIGRSIATYGEFSELEADIFKQICKTSDTIIEVGANIGTHTQIFSKIVGNNGKVFAFEPQRIVFQTLCANIALNSLTNVFTYQIALGEENSYITIPKLDYSKSNNFGGISLKEDSNGERVEKRKLDSFSNLISQLKLIKIDVEGMESEVIKGAKNLIEKYQPFIYLENDRQEKSKELIELVKSLGYELYWHLPPLFNPNNFKKENKNLFGNIVSVNMLCVHKTKKIKIENLTKIENSNYHPMKRKYMQKQELQSLFNQAHKAYQEGAFEEAKKFYIQILKHDAKNSEALSNLGVIEKRFGNNKNAYDCYIKAIQSNPKYTLSFNNLGNLLKDTGNYKAALKVYSDAIKLEPKNFQAYNNLGMVYEKLNNLDKAILAYKEAVRINPNFSKAVNNIAVVLYKQKKYAQAVEIFKIALKVDPKYFEVYSNIGACYNKMKMYDEAIKNLDIAIEKNPKNAGAYTNLGNVYNKLHDYKKAAKLHEKSIELEPKGANAYSNVGTSYKYLGQNQKAIDSYKKAIELDPRFVNAHFDLATMYLANGDYENGFKEYEWRFRKEEMLSHIVKYKDIFSKPMFTGKEDLKGKTILLHSEQGFGDSIQFVRFVSEFKKKFPCIIAMKCRDELTELFKGIKEIDILTKRSEPTPAFDYHLAIMSLPYILGIKSTKELPKEQPYLFAKDDSEFKIEKKKGHLNIGICWSASITGESYEGKVFPLEYFKALANCEKITLYSLQVGSEKEDIKKLGLEDKIVDLTSKLTDFSKTASLMKNLDLVISSDTSVVHLAGAINTPVWIPLQKTPDWRWENKGQTTPWYKSAKLFRQKTARQWDSVFQSIYDKIFSTYKIKIN